MEQGNGAFGEFVTRRRKERGMTLRGLADKLGIAPAYLSDIEKGRRYAPDGKLDEMASLLGLVGDEKDLFLDLAALTRVDQVSSDLSGYIMDTDLARVALRRARDAHLSEEGWHHVIETINRHAQDD